MQLLQGDCLEHLAHIPNGSVDMVLTDPPYMINIKSDVRSKLNPWADWCNASYWYTAWISEARRVLKPTSCLWSFINWRSLVTFQKAACTLGWPIESLLVWDKEWIGPSTRGLRPSYELVALWAMPDFRIKDRSLADIQRFKWGSFKPHRHPAEKPEALASWLIAHCTEPGQLILDPFMGSGTTGAAAVKLGRDFLGIEEDPGWVEAAKQRIQSTSP